MGVPARSMHFWFDQMLARELARLETYEDANREYGDNCRYAHGEHVFAQNAGAADGGIKTKYCREWQAMGWCPFGRECKFLHAGKPSDAGRAGSRKEGPLLLSGTCLPPAGQSYTSDLNWEAPHSAWSLNHRDDSARCFILSLTMNALCPRGKVIVLTFR